MNANPLIILAAALGALFLVNRMDEKQSDQEKESSDGTHSQERGGSAARHLGVQAPADQPGVTAPATAPITEPGVINSPEPQPS